MNRLLLLSALLLGCAHGRDPCAMVICHDGTDEVPCFQGFADQLDGGAPFDLSACWGKQ